MKKDILISGVFVILAALGIGAVFVWVGQPAADAPKTIKPRKEEQQVVLLPEKTAKEDHKTEPAKIRKIPLRPTSSSKDEKKEASVVKKTEEPQPQKSESAKVPAPIIKPGVAKIIVLGNITKLNDPDGEYTAKGLANEDEITLLGKIKLLKAGPVNGKSILDASGLEAREIAFTGDIVGDAQVKLFAPGGTVIIQGEIHGSGRLEVVAPEGKVVFQNNSAPIIKGGAKVTVIAKDVELNGEINGSGLATVTLTKNGSLKFSKVAGGAHLHYGKANVNDPEPRLEPGLVTPGAELRKLAAGK